MAGAPALRAITDITIPEPGSTTAREVLSLALRQLLRDTLDLPRTAPPSARPEALALRTILERAAKTAPGPLFAALRRPTISTLARCLRPARALPDEARDALFVELVAGLRHDLTGAGVDLPETPVAACRHASCPSWTTATDTRSGAVSHPYHPIAKDLVLALADNNPLAMEEAHPDKEGNALDLGGHPVEEWTAILRDALTLVEVHLPDLAAEIHLFVQQIVPVGHDEHRHLSASYQEAIGTVYMTLHPSLMTMTEALIHEFSHNKINALFELDDLLENAWSPSTPHRSAPTPARSTASSSPCTPSSPSPASTRR